MDITTHEVRLAQWLPIITQCQAGPIGQTVKQWTTENGIHIKQYYYWLRRIRKEAYTQHQEKISDVHSLDVTGFAEFPLSTLDSSNRIFQPDAVIRKGCMTIEISNSISESLLSRILSEVAHAE